MRSSNLWGGMGVFLVVVLGMLGLCVDTALALDGAGHKVLNLTINTGGIGSDYLGLFGRIGIGYSELFGTIGEIKNLGIENCNITGGDSSVLLGGLCGKNSDGIVINCYATGMVKGGDNSFFLGGLCGYNSYGTSTITNCLWDIDTQTHGVTESIGNNQGTITNVLGLPTHQLHQQTTFTDWDFIGVWDIGENQTYPYLRKYPPSDLNKDRSTNFLDVIILSEQWCEEQ